MISLSESPSCGWWYCCGESGGSCGGWACYTGICREGVVGNYSGMLKGGSKTVGPGKSSSSGGMCAIVGTCRTPAERTCNSYTPSVGFRLVSIFNAKHSNVYVVSIWH